MVSFIYNDKPNIQFADCINICMMSDRLNRCYLDILTQISFATTGYYAVWNTVSLKILTDLINKFNSMCDDQYSTIKRM